ncbi:MAG: putative membrane protein [Paraglaciecola sp.]|jgi:hypothetical membrane protein
MSAKTQKILISLGIFGTFQFLILVHLAMYLYKGGSIHQPNLDTYSFTTNFFSDLGRYRLPNREMNVPTSLIFKTTMAVTGLCISLFFLAVPSLFKKGGTKALATIAAFFGIIAGISYILIGNIPYDLSYWAHTRYVRIGFISFFLMVIFYTSAIFAERDYPNRYGWLFILFGVILLIQISVMLLGPRSWQSEEALYLQAVAQKIVVYAEMICMLMQSIGALKVRQKQAVLN